MSQNLVGAPAAELQPKAQIDFNLRVPISRPMSQPLMVKDPVGLVVFGNSSALYLVHVADPGSEVYDKLGTVKATTYIHGWSVNAGWLYVLDGVELQGWNIRTGKKDATLKLIEGADAQTATNAQKDLQKVMQMVEWATLLEQAEDEWVRLTAQQSAAPLLSDERDRLDIEASNYFRMLRSMREITGSTGGAKAARDRVAALRKDLADKRADVQKWCFSKPVIRAGSVEQNLLSVFVLQGNGTLHACTKGLTGLENRNRAQNAELELALLESPRARLLGFIGEGKLRVVDATSLEEKSTWTPPAAGKTQSLTAANKQFWWAIDSGVYACEVSDSGQLSLALQSGRPFSGRQVGRIKQPNVDYTGVNPNDLFDAMNIHAWIRNRTTQSDPLTAGMMAQLMLSDANGKYVSPAEGSSYLIHGPFERDAQSAASTWIHTKAHPSRPLVLLSDNRGGSTLCRYPAVGSGSQLVPAWFVAPWLNSVTPDSAPDIALRNDWPAAPTVRALTKPHTDMVAKLQSFTAANPDLATALNMQTIYKGMMGHPFEDRDLRLMFWFALNNRSIPSVVSNYIITNMNTIGTKGLPLLFDSAAVTALRARFSGLGTSWDYMPTSPTDQPNLLFDNLKSKTPPVNFDPPWVWKTYPSLYHSRPPAWVDPWGYNSPGDFVATQPSATYLDPFCFNGNLRFPHRPVTFDAKFKGRRWATFTDNDPASLLASGKPAPILRADDADPSALVLTVDEDRQRATFQLLAPKLLRTTFEAASHTIKNEAQDYGWINEQVVAAPLVYKDALAANPSAWCVINEFPGERLRALAAVPTTGNSLWDTFITTNRTTFGPTSPTSKTWKIDLCPLPQDALPEVSLRAYTLKLS